MRRPSIKSNCVADSYHSPNERIVEFSTSSGQGGLIRVQERDDGSAVVEVYRADDRVTVLAPPTRPNCYTERRNTPGPASPNGPSTANIAWRQIPSLNFKQGRPWPARGD